MMQSLNIPFASCNMKQALSPIHKNESDAEKIQQKFQWFGVDIDQSLWEGKALCLTTLRCYLIVLNIYMS